ncbi:MAG: hypothetical protein KC431_31520 [Myxococcales bacterium]|nr:hypothetical protein [Myxococcales bacterium]
MTASRLVQGMVTALSWAVGSKIRAFSTVDFAGATDCLGLDEAQKAETRVQLRMLARSAGLEIDAFADESGWFRRKKND